MNKLDLPDGWVDLKGRAYPTWPVVLNAAHQKGLVGVETELLQIPNPENGNVAIVRCSVKFANADGTHLDCFSALGDASPANVGAFLIPALIRMAETRAKGRALRGACNIGQALLEEIGPDDEDQGAPRNAHTAAHRPGAQPAKHAQQCEYKSKEGTPCKRYLTGDQCAASKKATGHYLCPEHLGIVQRVRASKATQAAGEETLQEAEAAT